VDLKTLNKVYFIGIGGIGMSGLVHFFLDNGVCVAGYDKTRSPITDRLIDKGVDIIFDDKPELLPENIDLVIYTPAVKDELGIIKKLKNSGLRFMKRAEVLGMISKNIPTIAIAGTHGKTTVTSMLVHIMKYAGIRINGFVGGITKNYSSNYIGDDNPQWIVVEADEFDKSFLKLKPYYAVITSMDADHLDIYINQKSLKETFFQFINSIDKNGHLVIHDSLPYPDDLIVKVTGYSVEKPGDIFTRNFRHKNLINYFDVKGCVDIDNIKLKVPGYHNVENSLAAIAISHLLGIKSDTITNALSTYEGVKRRFDIKCYSDNIAYIDDYAHHPEELKAFIGSVRNLLPGKKITGVFQPHLYSRTNDFMDEFAESLQLLDELLLLDIYPAREKPIQGVSSKALFEKIKLENKYILRSDQVVEFLEKKDVEILLTMGAGDIDRLVDPLTILMNYKIKNEKYG